VQEARSFFQHCCEVVQMLREKGNLELMDLAEIKKEDLLVSSLKQQIESFK